jgi:hypothetical protein
LLAAGERPHPPERNELWRLTLEMRQRTWDGKRKGSGWGGGTQVLQG